MAEHVLKPIQGVVENLDEQIDEEMQAISSRARTFGLRALRIIGSVPENKQMNFMNMVLDGFINQSPVTTRVLTQEANDI